MSKISLKYFLIDKHTYVILHQDFSCGHKVLLIFVQSCFVHIAKSANSIMTALEDESAMTKFSMCSTNMLKLILISCGLNVYLRSRSSSDITLRADD